MRNNFPGYFKLNDSEIKDLWDKGLIALDANILLNLYRYSDDTREIFFQILEKSKDRIWIPYQSAKEFFDNRLNVMNQQEKAYEDSLSALISVEDEFKNSRQHPFISQGLLKKFTALKKEISEELNKNKEIHNLRITNDDILDRIENLFNNKVGDEFSKEKLEELYKEGEQRFSDKIPPGYKDSNKKDNTQKNIKQYGDYIVWEQILHKSEEEKQSIILVTDDRKDDWWIRFKGKTLGARPELTKEFKIRTNQAFYMYQADRFLEFARDYYNIEIKQKSIDEIRELRNLDEEKRKIEIERRRELMRREYRGVILENRLKLADEISFYEFEREKYEEIIKYEFEKIDSKDPYAIDFFKMNKLKDELKMLTEKEKELKLKFKKLDVSF